MLSLLLKENKIKFKQISKIKKKMNDDEEEDYDDDEDSQNSFHCSDSNNSSSIQKDIYNYHHKIYPTEIVFDESNELSELEKSSKFQTSLKKIKYKENSRIFIFEFEGTDSISKYFNHKNNLNKKLYDKLMTSWMFNFDQQLENFSKKEVFKNCIEQTISKGSLILNINMKFIQSLILLEKRNYCIKFDVEVDKDPILNLADITPHTILVWVFTNIVHVDKYVPFILIHQVYF